MIASAIMLMYIERYVYVVAVYQKVFVYFYYLRSLCNLKNHRITPRIIKNHRITPQINHTIMKPTGVDRGDGNIVYTQKTFISP